ncbi:MAG: DUF177 domain-containing protein [Desulfobacteraceae bacterium]|jgi:uncharacterized protein
MIIDLRTIPEETRISEVLKEEWWCPDGHEDQVLGFETPLQVDLKVSRVGDKYVLNGKISGGVQIRCDRCLEPFHWDLESTFNVYLALPPPGTGQTDVELLEEDMEVDFIRGEMIELDEILREQIYLSLPIKCICVESCLGLCSVCGANLNEGYCRCERESGHPAFSKLKNLKIKGE